MCAKIHSLTDLWLLVVIPRVLLAAMMLCVPLWLLRIAALLHLLPFDLPLSLSNFLDTPTHSETLRPQICHPTP